MVTTLANYGLWISRSVHKQKYTLFQRDLWSPLWSQKFTNKYRPELITKLLSLFEISRHNYNVSGESNNPIKYGSGNYSLSHGFRLRSKYTLVSLRCTAQRSHLWEIYRLSRYYLRWKFYREIVHVSTKKFVLMTILHSGS